MTRRRKKERRAWKTERKNKEMLRREKIENARGHMKTEERGEKRRRRKYDMKNEKKEQEGKEKR